MRTGALSTGCKPGSWNVVRACGTLHDIGEVVQGRSDVIQGRYDGTQVQSKKLKVYLLVVVPICCIYNYYTDYQH